MPDVYLDLEHLIALDAGRLALEREAEAQAAAGRFAASAETAHLAGVLRGLRVQVLQEGGPGGTQTSRPGRQT